MNDIDKFFSQFIGQSQGQGRFLRLSVENNLVGGSFIGRKDNQDYLKVKIDGLTLTSSGGVQSVTGLNTNNSDPLNPIIQISVGSGLSGNGTPASPLTATAGGGTVTGATISGALSVTGSVTLAFAWTGTTSQYVRGDGSLATFPTIPSVTPSNVTAASTKITLGGTPTGAALQAFSIDVNEADLTLNNIGGTLGVSKGGTNLTALGTSLQYLRVNTGATALEYATFPTIPTVTPSALTKTDDTNVTLTLGGTPATALLQATSLTLGWTGTLSTTRGGTGANNATNASGSFLRSNGVNGNYVASTLILPNTVPINQLLYASSANNIAGLAVSTTVGTFLRNTTTAGVPAWSTLILPNAATINRVVYATAANTYGQSQRFTFVDATSGTTGAQLTIGEASINNTGGQLYLGQSDTHASAGSLIRFGTATGGNNNQWTLLAFGLGYTAAADAAGSFFQFSAEDRKGTMRFVAATGAGTAQKFQIFCSDFSVGGNTYTGTTPNGLRFAPDNGMRIDLQTNLQGGDGQGGVGSTNYSRATALLDLGASTTTRASLRVRMGGAAPSALNLNIGDFYGTGTRDLNLNANLVLPTVGDGIKIKEGANATMGRAVLVAGAVTVNTNKVTATSEIFLTSNVDGGTVGFVRVSARVAGTSFTITSSNVLDTSTIAWIIIEPS